MEQVMLYLYETGSNFRYFYKVTEETIIVENIKEEKVSQLITLCDQEELVILFGSIGISITGTVEQ